MFNKRKPELSKGIRLVCI